MRPMDERVGAGEGAALGLHSVEAFLGRCGCVSVLIECMSYFLGARICADMGADG